MNSLRQIMDGLRLQEGAGGLLAPSVNWTFIREVMLRPNLVVNTGDGNYPVLSIRWTMINEEEIQ